MKSKSVLWRIGTLVALFIGISSCVGGLNISSRYTHSYETCADGWDSPSIGSQGACSWHGGVVVHEVDNRTDMQRYMCYGLDTLGVLGLFFALIMAGGPPGPRVRKIAIEGEVATVPLIIAHESRMVRVVRLKDGAYETQEAVALISCPAKRRKSVYASEIRFEKVGEQYRQNLSRWVHTGRGREGGYYAVAFCWKGQAQTDALSDGKNPI